MIKLDYLHIRFLPGAGLLRSFCGCKIEKQGNFKMAEQAVGGYRKYLSPQMHQDYT